jgi:transposase, IS5 family
VLKTNIHHPADSTLLFDSVRKTIDNCQFISKKYKIPGWKQAEYLVGKLKIKIRLSIKLKHSTSKNKIKKEERAKEILESQKSFLELAEKYLKLAETTPKVLSRRVFAPQETELLSHFMTYAYYILEQAKRRIINKEKKPHEEIIFSVLQPHTEWISKGKSGVPFELGKRVCICKDQHGFIIHHQVLDHQTDDQITVDFLREA